ncbi:ribosome assembly RNA-binding protein YhbY [Anaeromyxobacter paludicola]|uniref:CRM domain-containing protein n=1 Tax=Anaeromyxobacter paludicola TaxID=2918171 RepID=A0ABN6N8E6_9BACT|nr:ribosome assembly RNA-binding protein YhbY [Anaeromyxobacter paludicola]BDG09477.1 hypothetical protein AMPC_25900 [Anaeromyxobacter paludicola]
MPAPTSPKKKSLMPTGPLRRQLRAAGHHLHPIVQVGKEGVTDAVVRQLNQALYDHELVKVKVGTESPEDRFEAAEALAREAEAQLAQILGRTLLVYKKHPEKPKFEAGPARPAAAKARPAATSKARPARKPAPRAKPKAARKPRR